jgi:hypothetical protein
MTWNLHLQTNYECQELEIYYVLSSIPFSLQRLVFWHQEVECHELGSRLHYCCLAQSFGLVSSSHFLRVIN